jgi:hypothetical protein
MKNVQKAVKNAINIRILLFCLKKSGILQHIFTLRFNAATVIKMKAIRNEVILPISIGLVYILKKYENKYVIHVIINVPIKKEDGIRVSHLFSLNRGIQSLIIENPVAKATIRNSIPSI